MKHILFPVLMALLMSACTKVIDIDLNSAAPQIVIEAALQAGTNDFRVHITKTGNYFDTGAPETVNNATVLLKRGTENAIDLSNAGNGDYLLSNYSATENETYSLSVIIDGKTYEASSFLPPVVALDSLSIDLVQGPSFGTAEADSFLVLCHFQDPLSQTNFYRIKSVVNDVPRTNGETLLVIEDRLTNGNYIEIPIFTDSYELNDNVEVELVSMDAAMYDYFNSLTLLVGGNGGTAAPANPNTNWSGGALGSFGAFSSAKRTILVE